MACIENVPPVNGDSEMEEGEIVDELDYLSDISSEEEFLLRQRLEVLENYNNVLERKKAKHSSSGAGNNGKYVDLLPQDLSEISVTDNEEFFPQITSNKNNHQRYSKPKRRKGSGTVNLTKNKDKKKTHRVKKKLVSKIVESSEESDDEYRNKRRKLANAVVVHTPKPDTTTLRARLKKMFGTQSQEPVKVTVDKVPEYEQQNDLSVNSLKNSSNIELMNSLEIEKPLPEETSNNQIRICELIDLCNDDEVTIVSDDVNGQDTIDGIIEKNDTVPTEPTVGDSDEDLELLRQHALKTKSTKTKGDQLSTEAKSETEIKPLVQSEDEDSDTAELRLICLKSALLKKAIEMKQKQKMRKRLSQSIHEDFIIDDENMLRKSEAENNTDIESVDMDIGSDGDEKLKEISDHCELAIIERNDSELDKELNSSKNIPVPMSTQKEEVDEDEDLLRAKLLTSLSKNWPHLVDPTVIDTLTDVPSPDVPSSTAKSKTSAPVEKPFIIKLGESDSEGEHEATKNLTKMHIKLSEQIDFQQKLDLFLKSTRMEVEKQTLPDVVQKPPEQSTKFVAKTVRHLPKSEQIEYKNLVKRMAELEKIKQARQATVNLTNTLVPVKDTLKPRNAAIDTSKNFIVENLDQQIAVSRKKIAEESAKMLKLKEEATKLSQKYKIAATELRNIATAITFNKKEQRSVHSRLTQIRLQHQTLIKSSTSNKHSKTNMPLAVRNNTKLLSTTKLQKENDPSKEEYKNPQMLKSVKVSVANDLNEENTASARLSVQIDVSSNKKIIKMPKTSPKERTVDFIKHMNKNENLTEANKPTVEKGGGRKSDTEINNKDINNMVNNNDLNDYKSPLEALHSGNWEEDPNSFLCPFEVGGSCKDQDCKYLHPKAPSDQ